VTKAEEFLTENVYLRAWLDDFTDDIDMIGDRWTFIHWQRLTWSDYRYWKRARQPTKTRILTESKFSIYCITEDNLTAQELLEICDMTRRGKFVARKIHLGDRK